MTTTVKLPGHLEQQLRQRCVAEGRSISEVMRDALTAYLSQVPAAPMSAWQLGVDLFGQHQGSADLATQRKQHVADVWEDKHRAQR